MKLGYRVEGLEDRSSELKMEEKMKKDNNNVTNYKALFIFGLVIFIPVGVGLEIQGRGGMGFIAIGLIFIFAGLGHREKW